MKPFATNPKFHRAFTLIEVMLVVAIMGICLMMSYPAISALIHRAPMTQAVLDITDGCTQTRRQAVAQGRPKELRIHPQDGRMEIADAPQDTDLSAPIVSPSSDDSTPAVKPSHRLEDYKPFSATLSSDVHIELLDVNFTEYKDEDVAAIRFFPNGTSDEFTMIITAQGEYRKITLEVVTGLPSVNLVR